VLSVLASSGDNRELTQLVSWALPIQERHFKGVTQASLKLAGEEDPDGPARRVALPTPAPLSVWPRGEHLRLYRFSPDDYLELRAVFGGPHPETGEELVVEDGTPEGAPAFDLPSQPAVFAPDYASEEIAQIAEKLRTDAGTVDGAERRGGTTTLAGGQRQHPAAEGGQLEVAVPVAD